MINNLKKLLEDNYTIFEENKNSDIYFIRNGIVEQEKFLRIKDISFAWNVYVCHRGNKREIGLFKNQEDVLAVVFILCKKIFENKLSNSILREKIRNIDIENIQQEAARVIKSEIEEKYFSLDNLKMKAININEKDNKFDIFYIDEINGKIPLASSDDINSAYAILYNFASSLKTFNLNFDILSEKAFVESIKYETLIRYYLEG